MLPFASCCASSELDLVAGEAGLDHAGALGAHLRARGPDAVAVGRRAAADHRAAARRRRRSSAPTCSGSPTTGSPASASASGFAHEHVPEALRAAAAEHGFPLFEVPVRPAVHRDHREGVLAARQRAVRGAAARARRRTSGWSGSCSPSAGWTGVAAALGVADRRAGADLRRAAASCSRGAAGRRAAARSSATLSAELRERARAGARRGYVRARTARRGRAGAPGRAAPDDRRPRRPAARGVAGRGQGRGRAARARPPDRCTRR